MLSPSSSRVLQALTLGSLVFGVTFSYLRFDFFLLFLLVPGFFVTAAVALALPADAAVRLLLKREAPHLKTAWIPAAFLLVSFASYEFRAPFLRCGAALRLELNRAEYEKAIAGVNSEATLYYHETSPRPLYAFVWEGISDNMSSIVHDAAEDFTALPRNVLGSWAVYRLHLWGPWYYVEFS